MSVETFPRRKQQKTVRDGGFEAASDEGEAAGFAEMPGRPGSAMSGDHVKYLPPFDLVTKSLAFFEIKGERCVALPYAELMRLIKLFLASTDIDEQWYVRRYKDVGPAITAGQVASARLHFINDGYFEGRMAFPLEVNEASYLTRYPDVADAIANGTVPSAKQHYVENGYREGRTPDDL